MFEPNELTAMRGHARAVRQLERSIEMLPETAAAERAARGYETMFGGEGIGGAQQAVFRRIVEGAATPEETATAVFNAIGSGNPGNAVRMIDAIERIVGSQSPSMAAMRQGVWQRLTQTAGGKDQPGAQKLAQSINEFLNGRGRTISERLYTPVERDLMQRYADVVKRTVIPKYARTNSDTAPALAGMVRHAASAVSSALIGHIPLVGRFAHMGVEKVLEKSLGKISDASQAKKVAASLDHSKRLPPPDLTGLNPTTDTTRATGGRISKRPEGETYTAWRERVGWASGGRVLPHYIDANPTEAQKEAGNYRKGHTRVHGLDITIENARGQFRQGVGKDGKPWRVKMPSHYGYILGTVGRDRDHLDVYLGPHVRSTRVWAVDQLDAETGRFDEHKLFIGFATEAQVRRIYKAAFSDGKAEQRFGAIHETTIDGLKHWIKTGDTTRPIGEAA